MTKEKNSCIHLGGKKNAARNNLLQHQRLIINMSRPHSPVLSAAVVLLLVSLRLSIVMSGVVHAALPSPTTIQDTRSPWVNTHCAA